MFLRAFVRLLPVTVAMGARNKAAEDLFEFNQRDLNVSKEFT
jgi:hypothetical protein